MRPNRPEAPTARQNRHSRSDSQIVTYDEDDLAPLLEGKSDPIVLILDCVQDPHNLGACLRTADAAGVAMVVMPKDKSAPISETVIRVACGGAENVPLVRVTNLALAMDKLQDRGVRNAGPGGPPH